MILRGQMDIAGVPSPHMDWEAGNLSKACRKFKLHVDLMFSGPFKQKGQEEKCSNLLLWVGDKGQDTFNTWTLMEDEAKVLKSHYDHFEAYAMPRTNVIFVLLQYYGSQVRLLGNEAHRGVVQVDYIQHSVWTIQIPLPTFRSQICPG